MKSTNLEYNTDINVTDKLKKGNDYLREANSTLNESILMSRSIMENLNRNRETFIKSKEKLYDTEDSLNNSSRKLKKIYKWSWWL